MTLLLKLVLAPLLVVGSSLAGRRWGERLAGVLVAFPIVAGPILLITALEHGTRFGARAASASLLGLVSLAVFVVAFAYAGRRWNWLGSLTAAWAATVVADVLLAQVTVGAAGGLLAVLVAVGIAHRLVAALDQGVTAGAPAVAPWWDLPGRAAATAALVLTITGISTAVGPVVTGILAPFPIATSVVVAFVLAQQGPAAAVRTLAGVTRGLAGFAAFCFLLAILLVPAGIPWSFTAAVAGALVVQLAWRQRSPQARREVTDTIAADASGRKNRRSSGTG
ncbi:hypothetical protein AB0F81_03550 [Actinoplanes sp. NPDC024001]|uniref:hypothetical protein n=1 Tax=Actinoplanes sp. NPDC024001 TaxID=3154598 RepID=UPI0033D8C237